MILQILLTIVFGFGVLTLATVALLNTAGHRLHDGERKGLANNAVQFEYKYPADDAERLRWWFAAVPVWLGIAASMAVISVAQQQRCIGQPQVAAVFGKMKAAGAAMPRATVRMSPALGWLTPSRWCECHSPTCCSWGAPRRGG